MIDAHWKKKNWDEIISLLHAELQILKRYLAYFLPSVFVKVWKMFQADFLQLLFENCTIKNAIYPIITNCTPVARYVKFASSR